MTYALLAALYVFIALSIADAVLTRKFLALGVGEANPIMRKVISALGPAWVAVKCSLAFGAVLAVAIVLVPLGFTVHALVGAALADLLMLVVCVRNWNTIKRRQYNDALVNSGNYERV